MRAVQGTSSTILIGRSARKGTSQIRSAAAAAVVAAFSSIIAPGLQANTPVNVPNGASNLSTIGASSTSDVTFTSGTTYSPTAFNTGSSALAFGTIDDLDSTQALVIADAAGSITLSGGTNSQPGGLPAATDLLYVASGGTLDLSGVPLTLAPSTTATINANGNLNLGTLSSAALSTYTFTGSGTTSVGAINTATFLGSINVVSGTLISNATVASTAGYIAGSFGTGTIMLGGGGSANATIISSQTESLSNGSISNSGTLSNPISTVAGTTGTLKIAGIPTISGTTATFSGRITATAGTTLTLGLGGNTGTLQTIMGLRGNPGINIGAGSTLNIDPGVNTLNGLPNIVELASTGTFGLAAGATANVNVLSGCFRLASNSSAFNSRFAVMNLSANTQLDLNKNMSCAGLNGTSSAVIFNSDVLNYATTTSDVSTTVLSQGTLTTAATYTFAGQLTNPTGLYATPYPVAIATASPFTGTQIYTGNLSFFSLTNAAGTFETGTVASAGGTLELLGNNAFSGTVSVSGGTLILNGINTFGNNIAAPVPTITPYPVPVQTAASNTTGVLSVNSLPNNGSASAIGTTSTLPLGAVSSTGTLLSETLLYTGPTAVSNLLISGGGGNLTMAGTGTLTLSAKSTYAPITTVTTTAGPVGGVTTVTSGTLDITGGITGSGSINLTAANAPATLILDAASAVGSTSIVTGTTTGTGLPALIVNASQTIGSISSVGSNTFTAGTSTIGSITGIGSTFVSAAASVTAGTFTQGALSNNGTTQINGTGTIGQLTGTGTLGIGTASSGNTVQLAALATPNSFTHSQGGLNIAAGGTLDITNNTINVNYGSGSSPLASIANAVAYGAGIGTATSANGAILSSAANTANSGLSNKNTYAVGYADHTEIAAVPSGNVAIEYTLAGDTNLDGVVNFTDYSNLQNGYGKTGKNWAEGDFNHDGLVNFTDYSILQNNYGKPGVNAPSPLVASSPSSLTLHGVSAMGNVTSTLAVAASFVGPAQAVTRAVATPSAFVGPTKSALTTLATGTPTLTYTLSINDNGSGQYAAGKYAVYVSDSTADGNAGLALYQVALSNTTSVTNFSPKGNYDDGTGNNTDDTIGFTANRTSTSATIQAAQDTLDYPNGGVILAYGMGQTAGNLANDEAPGSTGPDGTPTQPVYGAPLELAKGNFTVGTNPVFSSMSSDLGNVFESTSSYFTDPATLLFSTQTLSATPEPASFSILGIAAVGLLKRKRRNAAMQTTESNCC